MDNNDELTNLLKASANILEPNKHLKAEYNTIKDLAMRNQQMASKIVELEAERRSALSVQEGLALKIVDLQTDNAKLSDALRQSCEIIEALISSKRIVNLDEALTYFKSLNS